MKQQPDERGDLNVVRSGAARKKKNRVCGRKTQASGSPRTIKRTGLKTGN